MLDLKRDSPVKLEASNKMSYCHIYLSSLWFDYPLLSHIPAIKTPIIIYYTRLPISCYKISSQNTHKKVQKELKFKKSHKSTQK